VWRTQSAPNPVYPELVEGLLFFLETALDGTKKNQPMTFGPLRDDKLRVNGFGWQFGSTARRSDRKSRPGWDGFFV
jgi:hypothetical protein